MRDIEAIRKRIPLRFPYLMLDRLLEEGPERVVALKNVTINEPFFQGHFPEPLPAIMPGTLILEAMAQTAAFLAGGDGATEGYLVGVAEARFRRRVVPGDQIRITAVPVRRKQGLLQADVEAVVEGERVASARISLLVAGDRGAVDP
jgi:3-hydroxyacyl-[acyl-carrier-protein] dehydratase